MRKIRKIVFLTGTRADYGKLMPLMDSVEKSKHFQCFIFITGMHTLSKYGKTFTEVLHHGFKNTFVFMNQTHTTDPDIILANTIMGFSNFVKEVSPDLIIVHGDRIEALGAAIVGSLNNILVAHIEGGETSGTIDESIRHAVTKLSHIHFVANEDAKRRLTQLGEVAGNIFVIGSSDIDVMMRKDLPSIHMVRRHYQIPFTQFGVLIFHPVSSEINTLRDQIKEVVDAAIKSNENFIVIYPNNDNGSDIILHEYKQLTNNKRFKIFPSIRFEYFLTILRHSRFILGNSSAGIREAEVYGVPSINIGTRQNNRTSNPNIINVPSNRTKILKAIKKARGSEILPSYDFGDGKSTQKFMEIITNHQVWKTNIQKMFVDLV